MKERSSRGRVRGPQPLLSKKNSTIRVDKSFKVSVDSCTFETNRLGIQQSLTPYPTYRAETSIGRPSTARDSSESSTSHNNPVCPSPIVRRSPDHMDLHEALRSPHLPPFRQSKRWAKVYMNKHEQPSTVVVRGHTPRHLYHAFTCDVSQQAHNGTTASETATCDNESEHYRHCAPSRLLSWHVLKKYNFPKDPSPPVRVVKIRGATSPKRISSHKSVQSRLTASPQHTTPTDGAHGKDVDHAKPKPELVPETPTRCASHERQNPSQHSPISELSKDLLVNPNQLSTSPVSPLHDYEKVKRFSQECVDMLSGLDFGKEWRLSIFDRPSSSRYNPAQSTEAGDDAASSQQSDTLKSTSSASTDIDISLSSLSSRPRDGDPHAATSQMHRSGAMHIPRVNRLQDDINNHVVLSDIDTGKRDTFPSLNIRLMSSTSTLSKDVEGTITKNLKNARSVDTLTRIEAQVVDNSTSSTPRAVSEKTSSFTLSASPKRQRPSGGPPERPLPDLPLKDVFDTGSAINQRSSRESGQQDRVLLDSVEIPSSLDFGTELNEATFMSTMDASTSSNPTHETASLSKNKKASSLAEKMSRVRLNSRISSANALLDDTPLTMLKVRDIDSDRSTRVQEMKRRHIADLSRAQCYPSDSAKVDEARHLLELTDNEEKPQSSHASNLRKRTGVGQISRRDPSPNRDIPARTPALPHGPESVSSADTSTSGRFLGAASYSRASNDPVGPLSKKGFASMYHTSRMDRSRNRKLKHVASSQNLPLWSRAMDAPTQALGRSQIMVVVDSNPHTSAFRAGAISPAPSVALSESTPTTPATRKLGWKVSKPALVNVAASEHTASIKLVGIIGSLPPSVPKRHSSRSLRSQNASTHVFDSTGPKIASDRVRSPFPSSRGRSRTSHHCVLDSSDSELENASLLKQDSASTVSQTNTKSSAHNREPHKRRGSPLTVILQGEVRRADRELENLRRYEKKIEYFRKHLEQTLRVWDRMSPNGKRQYLASTFGILDKRSSIKTRASIKDNESVSAAASSVYSVRSSVRRMDEVIAKSLQEALNFAEKTSGESRRISHTSTTTVTNTDTDTDCFSDRANSTLGKRASGGSLTDPQDYDILPPPPPHPSRLASVDGQQLHKTKAESLGANLDDLRARLQATRLSSSPVRSCSVQRPSLPAPTVKGGAVAVVNESTTSSVKNSTVSTNRFAVAPWEAGEELTKVNDLPASRAKNQYEEVGHEVETDYESYLFDLQEEGLRTDQMDAMLAL